MAANNENRRDEGLQALGAKRNIVTITLPKFSNRSSTNIRVTITG